MKGVGDRVTLVLGSGLHQFRAEGGLTHIQDVTCAGDRVHYATNGTGVWSPPGQVVGTGLSQRDLTTCKPVD